MRSSHFVLITMLTILNLNGSTNVIAADTLAVLPGKITLTGPEARQRLLVEERRAGKSIRALTENVIWTSSHDNIVKVDQGMAIPVGNGQATLTAKVGTQQAQVVVDVERMQQPHVWSFRNHVQPVLAKTGCNSGACHGALAGKGGFKLSLRGYDVDTDFHTLTKQARGRRIELSDPGRSLLLTKPSGALPHKGGIRFSTDSLEYRVIAEWIAHGAPAPQAADPRLVKLEILPEHVILKPQQQQPFLVRAHFSDGHTEDVTPWVKYSSSHETVAKVDDQGQATVQGHGEGAIVAWYQSQITLARITVPYTNAVPAEVYTRAERRNFIDELGLAKLASLNIPPSPPCSDGEFLRRVYLDTLGILPTVEETQAFLADTAPDKRDQLIEKVLARPEFVDYWTYKWSDLLLVNGSMLRPNAVKAYSKFIRDSVAANKPWDQFARDVVTASGSSVENGATNFFALHQDPQEMTEHTCVAFLGLSINCARCHNHPLEKWTNDQYYGMANLFSRVRAKGWGGDFRSGDGVRTLYVEPTGDLLQPLTGKAQPPRPLDGEALSFDDTTDRRVHLAQWLTSPRNPYFSRAITNRVWANFFGVGLVEAVDDLRVSNPASHEELLSALANDLVDHKYDLKSLMRTILQSRTYARSSQILPGNKDDSRFYSRYYPRRLMAEILLDSISQVTGVPSKFKDFPDGTRALQLPDSNVDSYFLKTFGRPERVITCECERSDEPSMVQVLHIANGNTINDRLRAKESRLSKALDDKQSDEQILDQLYLSALSRWPTASEKERLLPLLAEPDPNEKRAALEDLYWSVLSSKEFLFNH